MKTFKYFLYLCMISLLISSCDERDYDAPPVTIPDYPAEKGNVTIKQLYEKYANLSMPIAVTDNDTLKAVVVANDQSGNIYKKLYVADATGGISISINETGLYALYRVGQTVFIELKGLYIGEGGTDGDLAIGGGIYNNRVGQMTPVDFDEHVFRKGLPDPTDVDAQPVLVTNPSDILSNPEFYYNKLIKLENVKFASGGKDVFAPAGSANNAKDQLITDKDGNNILASSTPLNVRTSVYAKFSRDTIPAGVGTIVGIISKYNTYWQFTIRDLNDLIGFGDKGTKDNPFTVAEAIAKGVDTQNKWWTKGYIIGTTGLNISSSNPIKGKDDFILSGEFLDNTIVIASSENESDWTKYMVIELPSGSDIKSALNLKDHPENKGKEVSINGLLQKVFNANGIVTTGSKDDYVFETGVPPVTDGDGSKDSPYNVTQAKANQGAAGNTNYYWIQGYIVGTYNDPDQSYTPRFEAPFSVNTNFLVANSADERNVANCIVIQLPVSIRGDLNLKDHPEILGSLVKLEGTLEKYFQMEGLKNTRDYVLDGVTPPTPEPGDAVLDASFKTGFDGFTPVSVKGDQTWLHDATNGYVKMTGFVGGTNNENEDWLISPAINLTGKTSATLTFDHTGRMFDGLPTMKDDLTLWVSSNYTSGQPSTATWTQVTIPTYMSGNDWAFVSSGNISLSSLVGKSNARIAFKFVSTSTYSGNWEIKNVIVK
ncbi:MAG: DUF5689 domain-containing protein [Dysgonomonas sp.]